MWCHGYLLSLSKSIHLIYDLHISKTNHHLVTHLRTSSLLDNKLTSLIWPLQVFFIYFILEDGVIHHSSWTAVKKQTKKKTSESQSVKTITNFSCVNLWQALPLAVVQHVETMTLWHRDRPPAFSVSPDSSHHFCNTDHWQEQGSVIYKHDVATQLNPQTVTSIATVLLKLKHVPTKSTLNTGSRLFCQILKSRKKKQKNFITRPVIKLSTKPSFNLDKWLVVDIYFKKGIISVFLSMLNFIFQCVCFV